MTFDHEFKDERLFYRLLGDGHARALNAKLSYACIPRPGIGLAEDVHVHVHVHVHVQYKYNVHVQLPVIVTGRSLAGF